MTKKKKQKLVAEFDVNFQFVSEAEKPCQASLTIKIKAEEKELPSELRSASFSVFGQYLVPLWGILTKLENEEVYYREQNDENLKGYNWESLAEVIEEKKEEAIESLEEAHKKNTKLADTQLSDYEEKVTI